MNKSIRWWVTAFVAVSTLVLVSTSAVVAFQVRPKTSRFDAKVIEDPTTSIDVVHDPVSDLPSPPRRARGLGSFPRRERPLDGPPGSPVGRAAAGRRAGHPLARGAGSDRRVDRHRAARRSSPPTRSLLKAEDDELVLDRDGLREAHPRRLAGRLLPRGSRAFPWSASATSSRSATAI